MRSQNLSTFTIGDHQTSWETLHILSTCWTSFFTHRASARSPFSLERLFGFHEWIRSSSFNGERVQVSSPPAWWPQAGPGPLWPGAGLCWACVYYTGTRSCHALGKAVWQQIWTLCPFCSGQFDHSRKIKFSIGINIEVMRAGNCSRWPNTGTSLDWRFPK